MSLPGQDNDKVNVGASNDDSVSASAKNNVELNERKMPSVTRKPEDTTALFANLYELLLQTMQKICAMEKWCREDDDRLFLISLTSDIKPLSDGVKRQLKSKIVRLISEAHETDAKLASINSTSNSSIPPKVPHSDISSQSVFFKPPGETLNGPSSSTLWKVTSTGPCDSGKMPCSESGSGAAKAVPKTDSSDGKCNGTSVKVEKNSNTPKINGSPTNTQKPGPSRIRSSRVFVRSNASMNSHEETPQPGPSTSQSNEHSKRKVDKLDHIISCGCTSCTNISNIRLHNLSTLPSLKKTQERTERMRAAAAHELRKRKKNSPKGKSLSGVFPYKRKFFKSGGLRELIDRAPLRTETSSSSDDGTYSDGLSDFTDSDHIHSYHRRDDSDSDQEKGKNSAFDELFKSYKAYDYNKTV